MKVNRIGIRLKIIAWLGSGGGGLSFICTHMVMPIRTGQKPRCRKWPINGMTVGSKGMSPNSVKILVGSGAARSWIQPMNGACRISSEMKMTV